MKYYCIGIKGTGMSTLAQILYDLGNEVSGYDDAVGHKFTQDGLEKRNIPIYYDHDHSIDDDTIITYSVAFTEDHPEMKRLKELGFKFVKYNELMGQVIDLFETVCVSGTHGKTTTSSMVKHFLEESVGCNYFIGAGDGYADKKNKYYVVESDEFNKHFLTYHGVYSIITNIEEEHMECYKDIDDIRKTFEIFANQTKKLVIANGDNKEVREINFKVPVKFYGFDDNNDIVIKNMKLLESGSVFDLYVDQKFWGHFDIPLYGKHMIYNATASIFVAHELGLAIDVIQQLLKSFKNAKRRLAEERLKNMIIIDDYAHHPTEIKVTLEAVKQKYPNRRLVVIFAPNTYSRVRDFETEFVDALNIADKAYLTEIDCNRERQEDYPGISSRLIVNKLRDGDIISSDSIDKLKNESDSVICFMSCAYIDYLIEALKEMVNN